MSTALPPVPQLRTCTPSIKKSIDARELDAVVIAGRDDVAHRDFRSVMFGARRGERAAVVDVEAVADLVAKHEIGDRDLLSRR